MRPSPNRQDTEPSPTVRPRLPKCLKEVGVPCEYASERWAMADHQPLALIGPRDPQRLFEGTTLPVLPDKTEQQQGEVDDPPTSQQGGR